MNNCWRRKKECWLKGSRTGNTIINIRHTLLYPTWVFFPSLHNVRRNALISRSTGRPADRWTELTTEGSSSEQTFLKICCPFCLKRSSGFSIETCPVLDQRTTIFNLVCCLAFITDTISFGRSRMLIISYLSRSQTMIPT